MVKVLHEFGFGSLGLSEADFIEPEQIIQPGRPPVRIDLLTSISGAPGDKADAGKSPGSYGDIPVHFLGRAELAANKRAAGRAKDLADLEALGEKSYWPAAQPRFLPESRRKRKTIAPRIDRINPLVAA